MRTRKIKKSKKQVIAGALAATFLTASCTQYNIPEKDFGKDTEMGDFDLGKIAIPISLKINPEDIEYILVIQRLTDDILKDPNIAKELNLNPESLLRQYGYDGVVYLDDGLLKITQALADTDLLNAIKTNDFKTYLNISAEKGLLKSTESVFSKSFYEQQLDFLLQHKDVKRYLEDNKMILKTGMNNEVADFFILYNVTFAININVTTNFAFSINSVAVTYVSVMTQVSGNSISGGDLNAIDIFIINSDNPNTFIVVDKEIEEMTDKSIEVIKIAQPNYFETVSELETRNIIKINLLNSLK